MKFSANFNYILGSRKNFTEVRIISVGIFMGFGEMEVVQ